MQLLNIINLTFTISYISLAISNLIGNCNTWSIVLLMRPMRAAKTIKAILLVQHNLRVDNIALKIINGVITTIINMKINIEVKIHYYLLLNIEHERCKSIFSL